MEDRYGTIYYAAVLIGAEFGYGFLVSLHTATLAPITPDALPDPRGGNAAVSSDSSSTPMVGPDGDVYFGVLEASCCSSPSIKALILT
jgi:hypothetical protein